MGNEYFIVNSGMTSTGMSGVDGDKDNHYFNVSGSTFGFAKFYAAGPSGVAQSYDGINWTISYDSSDGAPFDFNSIAFNSDGGSLYPNGKVAAAGDNGAYIYRGAPDVWTQDTYSNTNVDFASIASSNIEDYFNLMSDQPTGTTTQRFVPNESDVWRTAVNSTTLAAKTLKYWPSTVQFVSPRYMSTGIISGLSDENYWWSDDAGATWNVQSFNLYSSLSYYFKPQAMASNVDRVVMLMNNTTGTNHVAHSTDGTSWTAHTCPVGDWTDMVYSEFQDLWVAVGQGTFGTYQVMTSPDAINWTVRTPAEYNNWQSITYSEELNLYVAVNNGSSSFKTMSSNDGITWTTGSFPDNHQLRSVIATG